MALQTKEDHYMIYSYYSYYFKPFLVEFAEKLLYHDIYCPPLGQTFFLNMHPSAQAKQMEVGFSCLNEDQGEMVLRAGPDGWLAGKEGFSTVNPH